MSETTATEEGRAFVRRVLTVDCEDGSRLGFPFDVPASGPSSGFPEKIACAKARARLGQTERRPTRAYVLRDDRVRYYHDDGTLTGSLPPLKHHEMSLDHEVDLARVAPEPPPTEAR